jgi:hypothetical protein
MGKVTEYDMPASSSDRFTWRGIITAFAVVITVIVGVAAFLSWRDLGLDAERVHLYRVAYSDPKITSFTGQVSTASFALIPQKQRLPLSRSIHEDWHREALQDHISGRARLLVIGAKEGGIFTITYTYFHPSDTFRVDRIEGPPGY